MMAPDSCPRIILNDNVLREDYIPPDLARRHAHASSIRACAEPIVSGRRGMHVWLHGTPGSGKTSLAKALLEELHQGSTIPHVVVNCWERRTLYEALDQIVTHLRIFRAEEHRISVKLERIRRHLDGRWLMVLLDEIDKIAPAERSRILYNLDALGNVGLICISNNLDALCEVEERVRSRINPATICFDTYSPAQIVDILRERAELALVQGSCPDQVLFRIGRLSAGDARIGIQTLRRAAEEAERACRPRITSGDVESAWRDQQKVKTRRLLAGLTEDHRILRMIVLERKEVLSTDLWEMYLQRCSRHGRRPIALRTFSDYVNDLGNAGLLTRERARVKGNVRLLKAVA
jgi:archaeal cell division control protein 6